MQVPVAGLLISVLSHVAGPFMAIPSPGQLSAAVPSATAGVTITVPTYILAGRLEPELNGPDPAPASASATDLNEAAPLAEMASSARPGRDTGWAWVAAVFFGILAVVGAVWLHRKVNPPLMTPVSAATESQSKPESESERGAQPGGAPSA